MLASSVFEGTWLLSNSLPVVEEEKLKENKITNQNNNILAESIEYIISLRYNTKNRHNEKGSVYYPNHTVSCGLIVAYLLAATHIISMML